MHIREQLQVYGASTVSTEELLAFVLAREPSSPRLLAHLTRLLQNPSRLRQASLTELVQAGLNQAQAERLAAICELARRLHLPEETKPQINFPQDAAFTNLAFLRFVLAAIRASLTQSGTTARLPLIVLVRRPERARTCKPSPGTWKPNAGHTFAYFLTFTNYLMEDD